MNYQFAYLFCVGGKVAWSAETAESILHRTRDENEDEKRQIRNFIENPKAGTIHCTEYDVIVCMTTVEEE